MPIIDAKTKSVGSVRDVLKKSRLLPGMVNVLVVITKVGRKSHHKVGDYVIWPVAEEKIPQILKKELVVRELTDA